MEMKISKGEYCSRAMETATSLLAATLGNPKFKFKKELHNIQDLVFDHLGMAQLLMDELDYRIKEE